MKEPEPSHLCDQWTFRLSRDCSGKRAGDEKAEDMGEVRTAASEEAKIPWLPVRQAENPPPAGEGKVWPTEDEELMPSGTSELGPALVGVPEEYRPRV